MLPYFVMFMACTCVTFNLDLAGYLICRCISVKPWKGGYRQGVRICASNPKCLTNARWSGIEKLSNKAEGPYTGNTK